MRWRPDESRGWLAGGHGLGTEHSFSKSTIVLQPARSGVAVRMRGV